MHLPLHIWHTVLHPFLKQRRQYIVSSTQLEVCLHSFLNIARLYKAKRKTVCIQTPVHNVTLYPKQMQSYKFTGKMLLHPYYQQKMLH